MTTLTDKARDLIRAAVFTLVRESGGQVVKREVITGQPGWTDSEPEPLAGIAAARQLEWAAKDAVRAYARHARIDGLSWQQIGEALRFKADPQYGIVPAEQAFRHLASDLGSGSPSFGFTCGTCGGIVIDYGPELAPHDAEQGHAEGCERFAATVAEWDRQWGDE